MPLVYRGDPHWATGTPPLARVLEQISWHSHRRRAPQEMEPFQRLGMKEKKKNFLGSTDEQLDLLDHGFLTCF